MISTNDIILLCIIMLIMVFAGWWYLVGHEKHKIEKVQKKCYKLFRKQFPSTVLCPGKYGEANGDVSFMCKTCSRYAGNYVYKVDSLVDRRKSMK